MTANMCFSFSPIFSAVKENVNHVLNKKHEGGKSH